jgi:ribose transport system substrate-binding protein
MSRAAVWLLIVGVSVALCGCGGGGGGATGYKVAVIPKGLTHEFWKSIERGSRRAAADLKGQGVDVEVLWDGPHKEDDASDQIKIVQQKVGMGIKGLVLAPQHSEQMVPPVQDAVERGVKVVIIDSGLDPKALRENPSLIVKYVATDNYNGGKLAALQLLKVLEKEGKKAPRLFLFRYAPGSESTEQREKGFEDHIKSVVAEQEKKGEPTITLLEHNRGHFAGATVDSAQRSAGPILSLMRDKVDGIFAVNESSAYGMLLALRAAGMEKKVRFVGFDSSQPLLAAVRDGEIDALVIQDPYKMGYLGVWTVVQNLQGYDVRPDGKMEMSTGEYVVTRDNLDAVETREKFEPALQEKRKIDTPELKKR